MKKIMAFALTAVMTLALLVGCGDKTNNDANTGDDNANGGTVAETVSGTVSTDGSTSMEKVIGALSESVLAYDGIAIIVHPDNPVSDLSIEQINKLYTGEITNWKDVGGKDAQVVLIGREAASGTRDGFESITGTKDKCQYRQELTSTGDVITAVSQNPDAIGYASLASIKDSVKALNVDGVTPSEATVKDGSYKVQRPFVLVTVEGKALSPAAQSFFDYATSPAAADIIAKAGAVAAN